MITGINQSLSDNRSRSEKISPLRRAGHVSSSYQVYKNTLLEISALDLPVNLDAGKVELQCYDGWFPVPDGTQKFESTTLTKMQGLLDCVFTGTTLCVVIVTFLLCFRLLIPQCFGTASACYARLEPGCVARDLGNTDLENNVTSDVTFVNGTELMICYHKNLINFTSCCSSGSTSSTGKTCGNSQRNEQEKD